MSQSPEQWVPPQRVQQARRSRRRAEGLAGLAAGLLSFTLVALWNRPLGTSYRFLALAAVILALGASLTVWFQHVRATSRAGSWDPMGPTARGLLGYARALTLAALLGACIYYALQFMFR